MYPAAPTRGVCSIGIAALCLSGALATVGCASQSSRAQRDFDSGKRYFDQQKYAEASIKFQKSLKLNSGGRDAQYYLGISQFRLGDYVGAYHELQGVVDVSPAFLPARLDLADVFLAGNSPEKNREQVEAVQAVERDNPRAQLLLGRTYLAEKNAARAILEFRKAKELSPRDPSAWGLCAMAETAEKQYDAAEIDYRRALELDPDSAEAYINLSNLFGMTGRKGQVEPMLLAGKLRLPKAISLDLTLADYYYQQGRLEDIENLFAKRKTASVGSPVALATGDFWLAHNQVARAIAEYEGERQQRPDEFVDKKLVSAYITVGKIADAERLNAPLLKKHPKDVDSRAFDGAIAYFKGDFEKASQELQLVLKDDPKSLMANYYLGLTWMALEQPDRARAAFLQRVTLNDQFFHAYLKLADLAARSGDWQTVAAYGKTLVRLDRRAVEGYLALGESYLGLRDLTNAKKVLHIVGTFPNIPAQFYDCPPRLI
jgi:tetratricopeptide (TPR) repeat protein